MRILHFCNFADRIGGAEVYAHALVDGLRREGHEVTLFGASPRGEIDRPGLRVVMRPLHDPSRQVEDPAVQSALAEILARSRPEALHVHNLSAVSLEVIDFLFGCGIPLVHTVHDFHLLCPNSWCVRGDGSPCPGGAGAQCFQHGCTRNAPYDAWSVLLRAVLQSLVARRTPVALAPSTYLVERLRAHGWTNVRRQPYFIDAPSLEPASRDPNQLLYVGRLEREKGVDILLRAMPQVLAAVPRARLLVLGDGSQLTALKRLARQLGLEHPVQFLTEVERSGVWRHYATSSLAILPSLWSENSPLVAYECLATGLPMIGSRIGGIPELIEPGCGSTFRAGDPGDLALAVIHALRMSVEEREAMSRQGRQRAQGFERATHVGAIVEAYAEAIRLGAPPAGPADRTSLLPVLARVREQLAAHPSLQERLRALARTLGLPKLRRP